MLLADGNKNVKSSIAAKEALRKRVNKDVGIGDILFLDHLIYSLTFSWQFKNNLFCFYLIDFSALMLAFQIV